MWIFERFWFRTLQVVVVGVLGHAAIQECPCHVVYSILFVLHRLGDDLSIEMVVKTVVQVRLHRQRLVEELLEKVLKNKDVQSYEEGTNNGDIKSRKCVD